MIKLYIEIDLFFCSEHYLIWELIIIELLFR